MKKLYSQYIEILCACYNDIASAYPAQYEVEHKRDRAYLRRRFACEGMPFLTKKLPSLGKAIDKALANDLPLEVPSFMKKKGSKQPSFLGWLIGMVFSMECGCEKLDSFSPALVHLRQLLYLFYKLEMPYEDSDIQRVIDEFKSTDSGLSTPWSLSEPSHFREITYASRLISRILGPVSALDIKPRHGPGSVATGEKLDEKAYFKRDYQQLTLLYPLDAFYYMNANHVSECLTSSGLATRDDTGLLRPWIPMDYSTAKVVLVPKDSRGPRLISMEPLEIQWIQQGQCERLVSRLESHWLTKGQVNFKDQAVNRYLAWKSSLGSPPVSVSRTPKEFDSLPVAALSSSYDLVTLDMKEASDRVSVLHIYNLFPNNWIEALMASRSSHTELPSGEVLPLQKFAPMGSAVCFPVEALLFWALAVSAVHTLHPFMSLASAKKRVWVYGDDIICYREDYSVVIAALERTGLLLNANKCCTGRFFRESCGMDAYKGAIVTPLRIKKCLPECPSWTGQQLMSYIAYSNAAYDRGYTNLAHSLERLVQADVPIPYTTADSGACQFVRPDLDVRALNRKRGIKVRFCRNLHYCEAYGPTPRAAIKGHRPVTTESYFRSFLMMPDTTPCPSAPDDTRECIKGARLKPDQYSVPRRVTSKRGWKQISL